MKKFTKVLLLDGYSTRTLACVRSWGKKGIPFAVGGETRWDMSLFSRYCQERFVYTSPKSDLSKFIRDVNRYCKEFGADCIFPTSEAAIMACSTAKNDLVFAPIIPEESQMRMMFSKAVTLSIAERVGIRTPRTLYITKENRAGLKIADLSFPIVIKSETSEVLSSAKAVTNQKTAYVSNREELLRECESRSDAGNGVLLQEFIDGYGVGVSGIFAEGRPVALIGHRRLRESNPQGGPSALAESIEISPELYQASVAIIKEIGFTGPAMVEFKVDRKSNRPYLMEINGRFWGSVLLAQAAGLDLPYLFWKLMNGLDIAPEETTYRLGVRGRYLVGDTKCLLLSLKGKPANWPGEYPKRWPAFKSYLQGFFDKQTQDLILTSEDPNPFFARLVQDLV